MDVDPTAAHPFVRLPIDTPPSPQRSLRGLGVVNSTGYGTPGAPRRCSCSRRKRSSSSASAQMMNRRYASVTLRTCTHPLRHQPRSVAEGIFSSKANSSSHHSFGLWKPASMAASRRGRLVRPWRESIDRTVPALNACPRCGEWKPSALSGGEEFSSLWPASRSSFNRAISRL